MTDPCTTLANLRRPRLLMHAARFGLGDFRRERDLRRLIASAASPEETLPQLLSVEERLEATRRAGDLGYSPARHIDVLIALLAEARLLRRGSWA